MDCSPLGSWIFQPGVCCHFLLQGVFQDQGTNPCLLHWQWNSLPLSHLGSNIMYLDQLINSCKCALLIWSANFRGNSMRGIYWNSLHYLINFSINLKLKRSLKMKHTHKNWALLFQSSRSKSKPCCTVLSRSVMSRFFFFFLTPWTVVRQAPLSTGILQARILGVGCHALL